MFNKLLLLNLISISFLFSFDKETYIKECKINNIEACYTLATHLTTGKNAESQDSMEEGMEYMRKACIYGEQKACDRLGDNYFKEKSYGAARPYLITSCERGIKSACEAVGTIYRDGHDVKPDDVISRKFYEKACALKSGDACYNVAIIYRGGFGIEKNRVKEKEFYKKSCDTGLKAGCDRFIELDNEDRGIETTIWSKIKAWFE